MSEREPHEPLWMLAAGMLILFSWGFLGFGVLDAPFLYFLGVVLPCGYLVQERQLDAENHWNGVWLQLFSGAAFYIGFAAYAAIGWMLF